MALNKRGGELFMKDFHKRIMKFKAKSEIQKSRK